MGFFFLINYFITFLFLLKARKKSTTSLSKSIFILPRCSGIVLQPNSFLIQGLKNSEKLKKKKNPKNNRKY